MSKPMRCKFRGKKYIIKYVKEMSMSDSIGVCDSPNTKNKTIEISSSLKKRKELEILLHEALHACFWDLDEEAITETADNISRFLWKSGYRKNAKTK